jgi:AraC-like DNA-binding protein
LVTFFNTVILLGAIQGVIVSILLFRRKRHVQSECLLGFLILLMALASLNLYFYNTGIFDSTVLLRIIAAVVPLVIAMPMGPLTYFYIRSISEPSFILTRKHRLQFYSGFIDIVPQLTAIIFIAGVYLRLLNENPYPWGLFIDEYNKYADIPRWLSMTIYVWLSYTYINKEKEKGSTADPQKLAKLKWLQLFITVFLVFQAIWFIYLIPYVIPAYSNKLLDLVDWYPVYIPLAIMIYWLGIKGYIYTYTIPDPKKRSMTLPDNIVRDTTALLRKTMEVNKAYLNPALNLDLVAAETGIPVKTISGVLNQHLNQSFTEWVNGYRIGEFKQRVRQGQLEQLTISAIASECGFNSQATFQRIFKQYTGMTPSEYLKKAD